MKKRRVIILVSIAILFLCTIGIAYGYFTFNVTGNNTSSQTAIQSGRLSIQIENGNTINNLNMVPGDTLTKVFTVRNTGTASLTYSIILDNVINELVDKSDFTYTLVSNNGGYNTSSAQEFPSTDYAIVDQHTIASGAVHTYTLTITFVNKVTEQNNEMEKEVSATVQLNDGSFVNPYTVILDNQNATTPGTEAIYYKDNAWYDSTLLTSPVTSITIPTKTDYSFGGYYTQTNGQGTQIINATGQITGTVSSSTTLYAYWRIIPTPSFATSSWDDIILGYQAGKTSTLQTNMAAGTTRNITLTGGFGTHTVRIANLTPCSEVSVTSKSACGLVLEFADIITTHKMNNTMTNVGGWRDSSMRSFVNNDIYNVIPSELRNLIIDTNVVSGHGDRDSSNFITTDKLYLLSRKEIWNDSDYDTAQGATRQLDYYNTKGVTTSFYTPVIKLYGGNASGWWLRTAENGGDDNFSSVDSSGEGSDDISDSNVGVSPAFRLAN